MNTILRLMIEAERRENHTQEIDMAPWTSLAADVQEWTNFALACYGEADPIDQAHYLAGPNYLPEIERQYQADAPWEPAFYGDEIDPAARRQYPYNDAAQDAQAARHQPIRPPLTCGFCGLPAQGNYSDEQGEVCDACERDYGEDSGDDLLRAHMGFDWRTEERQ